MNHLEGELFSLFPLNLAQSILVHFGYPAQIQLSDPPQALFAKTYGLATIEEHDIHARKTPKILPEKAMTGSRLSSDNASAIITGTNHGTRHLMINQNFEEEDVSGPI